MFPGRLDLSTPGLTDRLLGLAQLASRPLTALLCFA